jgi:hypothetical protein
MSKIENTLWEDLIQAPEAEFALARRQPLERVRVRARASLTAAALVGIALVIVVVVVVVASAGTSTDPAYALTTNANGSVTLTVSELVGVHGANQRLASLGLPIVVARMESGCAATGQIVEIPITSASEIIESRRPEPVGPTWVIRPAAIPSGDTLQISLRYAKHPVTFGGQTTPALIGSWAIVRGTAPSCLTPETPGP